MDTTRNLIDEVDSQILDLLTRRQELAISLGEVKKELRIPSYDPDREKRILERLEGINAGKLPASAIAAIWREIFSASRLAQAPLKVAYLGPEGTFTHQAVLARFGSSAEAVASQTIEAAFTWVKNKTVDYAVLPVENTIQGIVGQTVDLLGAAKLPLVVDEVVLPINFVFGSQQEKLDGVKRIYSKHEAFPQCSKFLNQPALERAERIASTSTSAAAREAAADPEGAALAPDIAASLAGLPIRFRNVENSAHNKTRFLVLGHYQPARTGVDQTAVFARVRNVVGSLEQLLRAFSDRGINLTKIESRPMTGAENFESWFYIIFDGHIQDREVADIIEQNGMVWLGSYRRRDQTACWEGAA